MDDSPDTDGGIVTVFSIDASDINTVLQIFSLVTPGANMRTGRKNSGFSDIIIVRLTPGVLILLTFLAIRLVTIGVDMSVVPFA
ncbi:MAG: hypothetical protein FWH27_13115 [Planctomycetaceae bacterium]|nr:hypothetical protein [Planctomycetaceae bacterium]